jgi:hypothetical protein
MSDAMLFAISLAITALGLVASYGVAKRRGTASGLRGAAWSVVPLAATLTGVTEFVTDLVFSPAKWVGVALAGLAVVLYVVSGAMLRRGAADGGGRRGVAGPLGGAPRGQAGGARQRAVEKSSGAPAMDPDLQEIEEILRRRGIQ